MASSRYLLALLLSCSSSTQGSGLEDIPGQRADSGTAPFALEEQDQVLSLIAADRRQLEAVEPGVFAARIGGWLGAELSATGLLATADGDTIGLATVAYGDRELGGSEPGEGDCAPGAETIGTACVRQIELDHGPMTEWWASRADGLEHGWTLYEAPSAGPVAITVRLTEGQLLSVDDDGQGASMAGSTGGRWRYDALLAWDATGALVPAWMEAEGGDLVVRVDTTAVQWPVMVDPLLTTEDKITASDGAAVDLFGDSVAGAGDVDGDGYDDLVIGAQLDDDDGSASGSAYVYYGSSAGIDTSTEDKLIASDGAENDYFGASVAGAGDVNGDGYDDLVIGAWGVADNGWHSGSAYVYYGSSAGIDSSTEDKLIASDGAEGDWFGFSLAGAGDVDGDGYDDLVIGAYQDDDNGSAYVYYGSSAGIDSSTKDKLTASDGAADHRFGWSVAGAGDVDGDGYDDLVIGAYKDDDNGSESGSAYVYYGSSAGIDTSTEDKLIASDGAEDDLFGIIVAGAGDVDGDGYDDLVIGAYEDDDNGSESGSAYVYYGSSAGIDTSTEDKLTASDGAEGDQFGYKVSGAGDVDGDGYDDLVIGARVDDDNGLDTGSAYVYYGSSAGIDTSTEDKLIASDGAEGDQFGRSVAGAGDVDGDGYDDLVIGAPYDDDNGSNSGAAYVYYHDCRDEDEDEDEDGYCATSDCDDDDSSVGEVSTWYADTDSDGYGDASSTMTACDRPSGYTSDDQDCDDTDSAIHPRRHRGRGR
jgi:hypothetical protein